jgi:hypothetical protein
VLLQVDIPEHELSFVSDKFPGIAVLEAHLQTHTHTYKYKMYPYTGRLESKYDLFEYA